MATQDDLDSYSGDFHSGEAYVDIRPVIAVSACLLGQAVRYDGKHKRQDWLLDALGGEAELLPFCPEAGAGMGIPRPPIQVVSVAKGLRVRGLEDKNLDPTQALLHFAEQWIQGHARVDGVVFKARSPSCGLGTTPIYDGLGNVLETGDGLFAHALKMARPELAMGDEAGLQEGAVLQQFLHVARTLAARRTSGL